MAGPASRRLHSTGTIVAALLLWALPARAQFDSAQVSGVVQDATGAALPGVDVTLTHDATGQPRRAVTNETGLYTFPNVPVGTYTLSAALSGFKGFTKTGVQVSAWRQRSPARCPRRS